MADPSSVGGSVSTRTHDVRVDTEVTVRVVEKRVLGEGPAVLLVHGLGVGGGYWDLPVPGYSTMDHLAERGLRAYALDHRGYGGSTFVPGSTVRAETAARDVAAVLDFIRSGSTAAEICLVGHSWGGIVASMAAATNPELVDSLILIGMPYRRLHRQFEERLTLMRAACTSPDGCMPNPTHVGLEDRLCAHDPEVLAAYKQVVERDYPRIPVGILDDCRELPHTEYMARLACPVLVMCGAFETVVDRTDMLDLLDDLPSTNKGLLFVGNAGHLAGLERFAHRMIDRVLGDWALEWAEWSRIGEDCTGQRGMS